MAWKGRIVVDAAVLAGKPIVRGTRISVELIKNRCSDGWTVDQVLEAFPTLTREDVQAALAFEPRTM